MKHRGKIIATEVAKAVRSSILHQRMSRGTSSMPPPPPKNPASSPAAPPAAAQRQVLLKDKKIPPPSRGSSWVRKPRKAPDRRFLVWRERGNLFQNAGEVLYHRSRQQKAGGGGYPGDAGGNAPSAGGRGLALVGG
ncbi:hypothetical protein SDC9_81878 [bioreactor metagenome]|uniref:Uncharacterized protein n=1 Tax=bioreactor metagenome TaxID=1076179 RepID=A0A644Z4T9_9ZZZZ